MSKLNKKQASRTKPVPAALAVYIDLANVLPAPEQLPGSVSGDVLDRYWEDERQIAALAAKFNAFRDYLEGADLEVGLPVAAKLEDYPEEVGLPLEALRRCKYLGSIRALLRTFARNHAQWLPSAKGHAQSQSSENLLIGSRLEDLVSGHANEDGRFRVQHHPFLRALEGVELARIRECPICGNIFWAGRIDQPCCKTKCAKSRRTRRWRENYPGRYKEPRIVKAEKKHVVQPSTDEAREAALKQERNELEDKKAPSISRRPARLPVAGHK
jgi:hypothetical protein